MLECVLDGLLILLEIYSIGKIDLGVQDLKKAKHTA